MGAATDSKQSGIYRNDLPSGKTIALVPHVRASIVDITPDGKALVYCRYRNKGNSAVVVQPVESGESRRICRYIGKGRITWLDWHSGGKFILFLLRGEDFQVTLWQIPASGGSARQITKPFFGMDFLRVHPDGKRIAFSSMITLQHETRSIEHFLPR